MLYCNRCVDVILRHSLRISLGTYDVSSATISGLPPTLWLGFPGETDAHFEESLRFVEEIGFSQLHVFRYSPRKGTPAADYSDQVSPHVSTARSQAMIALGERLNTAFRQRMLGKQKEVLIEASREGENNHLAGFHGQLSPRPH